MPTKLEQANPGFKFKQIESISASSKTGYLFENSDILRGKVTFKLENEQTLESKFIELTFLVEDVVSTFKEFKPLDLSSDQRG